MLRDFNLDQDYTEVAFYPKSVIHSRRKPGFTKREERAAMAELREQRLMQAAVRHDPDWVARFWKRVSAS